MLFTLLIEAAPERLKLFWYFFGKSSEKVKKKGYVTVFFLYDGI